MPDALLLFRDRPTASSSHHATKPGCGLHLRRHAKRRRILRRNFRGPEKSPVSYSRSIAVMGTIVSIEVVHENSDTAQAVARALDWFMRVESCCSRFDRDSELVGLSNHIGIPTRVS